MTSSNTFTSLLFPAIPFDQKMREPFLVVLVGHHAAIFDLEFAAARFHSFEKTIQFFKVSPPDHLGFSQERERTFEIEKAHRMGKVEGHFRAVEQMKNREIVFAKTQV